MVTTDNQEGDLGFPVPPAKKILSSGPEAYKSLSVAGGYSDKVSLATAEMSVLVYMSSDDFDREVRKAGFLGGKVISEAGADAGVAWSQDVVVVAFRGSSEARDWFHDALSTVKVGWNRLFPNSDSLNGKPRVGLGFRIQAGRILPQVAYLLHRLRGLYPKAKIVLCGHSLGGALVYLGTVFLDREGLGCAACYAHEPPRPGNKPFRVYYDTAFRRTYTVINAVGGHIDLVTRVPKSSWGFDRPGHHAMLTDIPRDDGGKGGKILFGRDAEKEWQAHRAKNPVGMIQQYRILTRLARSIRAHYGASLLAALRARI